MQLWARFFLAQSQFFVSGNRKHVSKLSTGPEPALEPIWWKRGQRGIGSKLSEHELQSRKMKVSEK